MKISVFLKFTFQCPFCRDWSEQNFFAIDAEALLLAVHLLIFLHHQDLNCEAILQHELHRKIYSFHCGMLGLAIYQL